MESGESHVTDLPPKQACEMVHIHSAAGSNVVLAESCICLVDRLFVSCRSMPHPVESFPVSHVVVDRFFLPPPILLSVVY